MTCVSDVPIGDHALLGDFRSAALVTTAGSVDWLCFPRFDSPTVFARMLEEDAGYWLLAPVGASDAPRRRYVEQSLVLETTWTTPTGELQVTEALALGKDEGGHDIGAKSPGVLLRRALCTRGNVTVRMEYVPRLEYGLIHPLLASSSGGLLTRGGAGVLFLSTPLMLSVEGASGTGQVEVTAGEDVCFALEHSSDWTHSFEPWTPQQIRSRLADTIEGWASWSDLHQTYQGPLREQVHFSGRVLQALTYQPTGAIVAAPTTSLPEGVGTGRTWDYRFTWVRDASMTMRGLWIAACPNEAARYFSYLARAAATQLDRGLDLQIMFGVGGERDLSERELPQLRGWRDSGPVRVGNDAWSQRQLDVYGALLDAAYQLREQLGDLEGVTKRFLTAAVETAAARWREDDQGIWEIRGPAQPYLHSKLMCWVALDRGIALAEQLEAQERVTEWSTVRAAIKEEILTRGWDDTVGAFTQTLGGADLDASGLLTALVGFLPPDDPRLRSTIKAITVGLSDQRGLLYRYRSDDGIGGDEGAFLLCTFWLAEAQAVIGEIDDARKTLELAASFANPLGLLAEQVSSDTGELLGNFPQAFSHLGLVNAAWALAQATYGGDELGSDDPRPGPVSAPRGDGWVANAWRALTGG